MRDRPHVHSRDQRQSLRQRARILMILGEPIDHGVSATMPAAAMMPAWRIPPPSILRIRCAGR